MERLRPISLWGCCVGSLLACSTSQIWTTCTVTWQPETSWSTATWSVKCLTLASHVCWRMTTRAPTQPEWVWFSAAKTHDGSSTVKCWFSPHWPDCFSFPFSDREEKSPSVGPPLRPLHTGSSHQPVTCGALALWCGRSWRLGSGPTGTWATTRYGSADRDVFLSKMAHFGLRRSTLMTVSSAHSGLARWWWSLLLLTFNVIAAISSFLLFFVSSSGHEGHQRGVQAPRSNGLSVCHLSADAPVLAARPVQTTSLLRHCQLFGQAATKSGVIKTHRQLWPTVRKSQLCSEKTKRFSPHTYCKPLTRLDFCSSESPSACPAPAAATAPRSARCPNGWSPSEWASTARASAAPGSRAWSRCSPWGMSKCTHGTGAAPPLHAEPYQREKLLSWNICCPVCGGRNTLASAPHSSHSPRSFSSLQQCNKCRLN